MILSHSDRFIYTHLEKCGGTSVEKALAHNLYENVLILGSTIVGELRQAQMFAQWGEGRVKRDFLWKHSTTPQIYQFQKNNAWTSYKKFSVIRDPVELAKSLFAYSQKVTAYHVRDEHLWPSYIVYGTWPKGFPYTEDYVRSYITSAVKGKKFDGFVDDMIHNQYLCFSPYYWRLRPSVFDKDLGLVVDLSQLNDRWEEIQDYLDVPHHPLEHLNKSGSADLHISQVSVDRIKKRFEIDYDLMPEITGVHWS